MSWRAGRTGPAAVMLGLLCALALCGAGIELLKQGRLAGGGGATLAGLALFAAASHAARVTRRLDAADFAGARRHAPWLALGAAGFGLWIGLVVAVAHPDRPQAVVGLPTAYAWPLSVLLVTLGVLRLSPRRVRARAVRVVHAVRRHRAETMGIAAVVVAALLIRVHALDAHPYPWIADEASMGIEARRLLQGETTNLFSTGWSLQPYWSFVPTAVAFLLWGDSMYAVRMVAALIGTASVLATYLLARDLFGRRKALLAAVFLAGFPYHVHFSRLGVANVVDALSAPLLLWLAVRATRTSRLATWWTLGMAAGLLFYSYPGSRLVLPLAAAVLLRAALPNEAWPPGRRGSRLAAFSLAAVLVAGPMCVFFVENPVIFHGRFSQVGVVQSGWLLKEVARTGHGAARVLLDQLVQTLSVFVATPAVYNLFNYPGPYLTPVASVLFVIGLGAAFLHATELRFLVLLMWFWAVVILGGMLTVGTPANTRLVMTQPAVAILVAVGLTRVCGVVERIGAVSERAAAACALAVALGLAAHGAYSYLGPYRSGRYFDEAHSELAMELGRALGDLPGNPDLYLVTGGRVGVTVPTFRYLAPIARMYDVKPGDCDELAARPGALIASLPEHRDCLDGLARRLPGSEVRAVARQNGASVLYYYLAAPAGS